MEPETPVGIVEHQRFERLSVTVSQELDQNVDVIHVAAGDRKGLELLTARDNRFLDCAVAVRAFKEKMLDGRAAFAEVIACPCIVYPIVPIPRHVHTKAVQRG